MPGPAQPAELALAREASERISAALAAIAHIPTANNAHARAARRYASIAGAHIELVEEPPPPLPSDAQTVSIASLCADAAAEYAGMAAEHAAEAVRSASHTPAQAAAPRRARAGRRESPTEYTDEDAADYLASLHKDDPDRRSDAESE